VCVGRPICSFLSGLKVVAIYLAKKQILRRVLRQTIFNVQVPSAVTYFLPSDLNLRPDTCSISVFLGNVRNHVPNCR